MALNEQQVAILAEQRLKLDGRHRLQLMSFVSNALNDLAQTVVRDKNKRQYLITARDTTTASLTVGTPGTGFGSSASVSALLADPQIMLDELRRGTVYYKPPTSTWTNAEQSGNIITFTSAHYMQTGWAVTVSATGSLPTPLAANTTYYIIKLSNTAISFATSAANAGAGTAITLTGATSGAATLTPNAFQVCQWLSSPTMASFTPCHDLGNVSIWLEGTTVFTQASIGGSLYFAVPFVPTLLNLPALLEDDLIDAVVRIAVTSGLGSPPSEGS